MLATLVTLLLVVVASVVFGLSVVSVAFTAVLAHPGVVDGSNQTVGVVWYGMVWYGMVCGMWLPQGHNS